MWLPLPEGPLPEGSKEYESTAVGLLESTAQPEYEMQS